jgi:hypothetical protein
LGKDGNAQDETPDTSEIAPPPEEGKGVLEILGGGVKPVLDKVDDIQLDWQRDDRRTQPSLARRPGLLYQLGFTTNPGVPVVQDTTSGGLAPTQVEGRQITENTTIRTGARLPLDITTTLRYNYRSNIQIGTNQTKQTQLTFPDITANWNGLGKILFFPKIASNVRTNSHYLHENQKSYQSGDLSNQKNTNDFNPLVSVNFGWKLGISTDYSTSWRDSKEYRYTQTSTSVTHSAELTHKISAGYSIRGTKGFKLPLLGNIKFENQLTLGVAVQNTRRKNEAWSVGNEDDISVTADDNQWSITPSATYNFSRNIQGGMQMQWIDTKDNKTDKIHHVRDVSIWVELKF